MSIYERAVWIPTWKCQITNIYTDIGVFNSIREVCAILGVADARQQREQLQSRKVTSPFIRKWSIQTKRGKRETWCVHQDALGFWLATVNERFVREEFRDYLIQFQSDVLQMARRHIFGEVDGSASLADRNIIYLSERIGAPVSDVTFSEDEDE